MRQFPRRARTKASSECFLAAGCWSRLPADWPSRNERRPRFASFDWHISCREIGQRRASRPAVWHKLADLRDWPAVKLSVCSHDEPHKSRRPTFGGVADSAPESPAGRPAGRPLNRPSEGAAKWSGGRGGGGAQNGCARLKWLVGNQLSSPSNGRPEECGPTRARSLESSGGRECRPALGPDATAVRAARRAAVAQLVVRSRPLAARPTGGAATCLPARQAAVRYGRPAIWPSCDTAGRARAQHLPPARVGRGQIIN